MWEPHLWVVVLVGAVVAYLLLRYRETFLVKYGNPYDNEALVSFDKDEKGTRLFSTSPDTCPKEKSDLDAGLCYEPCERGYHGVGPVCWADTVNVGIGKAVGLEPCPEGWTNDGLTCRQPIRCEPVKCASGLDFFTKGCTGGGCSGGKIRGRLDGGGICDHQNKGNLPDHLVDKSDPKGYIATHPDKVAGLCYKKCPKEMPNHVPGMPYLCFEGSRGLSYGRGVGEVPPLWRFFE